MVNEFLIALCTVDEPVQWECREGLTCNFPSGKLVPLLGNTSATRAGVSSRKRRLSCYGTPQYIYRDVPGSPCLSKTGSVHGPFF